MKAKITMHQKITNQIIEAMKNSTGFEMPWNTNQGIPTNSFTDREYHGINNLSLWATAMERGYASNRWATYKQWQHLKGQVKRGEKGSTIVIYQPLEEVTEHDLMQCAIDKRTPRQRALIRSAAVFNIAQVSGVEIKPDTTDEAPVDKTERLMLVDEYIHNTKAIIETGSSGAYYDIAKDIINMPAREQFTGSATSEPTDAYYSTLLHELTHWTGICTRCDRDIKNRFRSKGYAMEELVAELGSAFLCAELGISNSPRQDHADYISNWIEVLQHDEKAVFWASAKASEATQYLRLFQRKIELDM